MRHIIVFSLLVLLSLGTYAQLADTVNLMNFRDNSNPAIQALWNGVTLDCNTNEILCHVDQDENLLHYVQGLYVLFISDAICVLTS